MTMLLSEWPEVWNIVPPLQEKQNMGFLGCSSRRKGILCEGVERCHARLWGCWNVGTPHLFYRFKQGAATQFT